MANPAENLNWSPRTIQVAGLRLQVYVDEDAPENTEVEWSLNDVIQFVWPSGDHHQRRKKFNAEGPNIKQVYRTLSSQDPPELRQYLTQEVPKNEQRAMLYERTVPTRWLVTFSFWVVEPKL